MAVKIIKINPDSDHNGGKTTVHDSNIRVIAQSHFKFIDNPLNAQPFVFLLPLLALLIWPPLTFSPEVCLWYCFYAPLAVRAIGFKAKYVMRFAGVVGKTLLMPTWKSSFQSSKRLVTTIGKSQGMLDLSSASLLKLLLKCQIILEVCWRSIGRIVILGSGWAGKADLHGF